MNTQALNDFFAWNMGQWHSIAEDRLMAEAEQQELFDLMVSEDLPETAMTMDVADGYLTGLAIGRHAPMVHEWMEDVFGQPTLPLPHDSARQQRLLALLRHRYLDIQLRLGTPAHALTTDNLFTPVHGEVPEDECIQPYRLDAQGQRMGNWMLKDWANGLRQGLQTSPLWDELFEDPDAILLLGPVMLLQLGYNPDRPEMQVDQHPTLQQDLVNVLYGMWRWGHAQSGEGVPAPAPYERDAPKVGRNDPCPCGSGKKYKKCCGA